MRFSVTKCYWPIKLDWYEEMLNARYVAARARLESNVKDRTPGNETHREGAPSDCTLRVKRI
jgi:hypothetical protein